MFLCEKHLKGHFRLRASSWRSFTRAWSVHEDHGTRWTGPRGPDSRFQSRRGGRQSLKHGTITARGHARGRGSPLYFTRIEAAPRGRERTRAPSAEIAAARAAVELRRFKLVKRLRHQLALKCGALGLSGPPLLVFERWLARAMLEGTRGVPTPMLPAVDAGGGLGRDLLARTLYGTRISLLVAIIATTVSVIVGVLYGAISGFVGGRIDQAMMRFVDVMYALPYILFVILFVISLSFNIFFIS